MAVKPIPIADRFMRHVNKSDGCWEWQGATKNGYGVFQMGRGVGVRIASRVAYELFVGAIGESWVLHRCDNPPCVRPDHLFLGDRAANGADMASKGRARSQKITECPQGHFYSKSNTYLDGRGRRRCRKCKLAKQRVRNAKTLEESSANRFRMGAPRRAITHCPQGHLYDRENTRHYRGRRHCRACARARREKDQ